MTEYKKHYLSYYQQLKITRVKTMLSTLQVALFFLIANELIFTPFDNIEIALLLGILFYRFLAYWCESDTIDIAVSLTLWSLFILACYFAWENSGLMDAAIIVFPCVLMLSFFLSSPWLSVPLYLVMMLLIFAFLFAHQNNLILLSHFSAQSYQIHAIDIAIILTFFAFITYLFVHDMKSTYRWLNRKNNALVKKLNHCFQQAHFDHITGLPNQLECAKQFSKLTNQQKKTDEKIAVICIDIHNLREINKTLGHKTGEALLIELKNRLLVLEQEHAFIYHFNNTEFIFLKKAANQEEITTFQEQIIQASSSTFQINAYEIELFISLGIAISPENGTELDDLIAKAHLALHYLHTPKVNSYHFYHQHMTLQLHHCLELISALQQGISKQEFVLYYQAKVDLATGKIVGAQAITKWHRPDFGVLPAKDFIPVAESSGHICQLSKWAINQACQTCSQWHQQGFSNLSITVKLSAVDFRKGNLPHIIFKALQKYQLSPHFFECIIDETIILDDVEHISKQLLQIQQKGIALTVNHFGRGYSNIHTLTQLNISNVIIDPYFTYQLLSSAQQLNFVKALLSMSTKLGVNNIAEHIDSQETAKLFSQLGCQFGQGEYFSAALDANAFLDLLQQK